MSVEAPYSLRHFQDVVRRIRNQHEDQEEEIKLRTFFWNLFKQAKLTGASINFGYETYKKFYNIKEFGNGNFVKFNEDHYMKFLLQAQKFVLQFERALEQVRLNNQEPEVDQFFA